LERWEAGVGNFGKSELKSGGSRESEILVRRESELEWESDILPPNPQPLFEPTEAN